MQNSSMDPSPSLGKPCSLLVEEAESGQKLLQLLGRRLALSQALLHRWIRTGQIRRNGSRCQPFERVCAGDLLRLPPFALNMASEVAKREPALPPLPPLLAVHNHLAAYVKPVGLPTHGGTGHVDSLASRLRATFQAEAFCPTPVHRLDKDTSGILLVAQTYAALRLAQGWFAERLVHKEYLCWVRGSWPYEDCVLLTDTLAKGMSAHGERVLVVEDAASGREAKSLVTLLQRQKTKSLLLVTLLTGRTHQIRVQLAHQNHPILGDHKYGDLLDHCRTLLLHACRLTLPDGYVFEHLPSWHAPYLVSALPRQVPVQSSILAKREKS